MIKNLKSILLTIAAALTIAAPVALTATASAADVTGNLCGGANFETGSSTNCTNDNNSFNTVLATIINTFSLIVGIVAVLMVIYGGFKYITSGGNDSNVGSAKNTILYAVIGLVVVAFAQIIVKFVINKAK